MKVRPYIPEVMSRGLTVYKKSFTTATTRFPFQQISAVVKITSEGTVSLKV